LTIVLAKCFAFKIVVKHQCCHFLFLRARTDTFMDKTPSRPNVFVRVPRKKKKDKPKKEPPKKNHKLSPHPYQQEFHPQWHATAHNGTKNYACNSPVWVVVFPPYNFRWVGSIATNTGGVFPRSFIDVTFPI